jgi:hypothetical protein
MSRRVTVLVRDPDTGEGLMQMDAVLPDDGEAFHVLLRAADTSLVARAQRYGPPASPLSGPA